MTSRTRSDNFHRWQEEELSDFLRMPDTISIQDRLPEDFSMGELRRLDQVIRDAQAQIVLMHENFPLGDGFVPLDVDGIVFDEVGTLEEMIAFRDSTVEWTIGEDTSGAVSLEGMRIKVPPFNRVEEAVPAVPQNTVCIIPKAHFVRDANGQPIVDEEGFYILEAPTVRTAASDLWDYHLCGSEERGDWPAAGVGSGVLLSDRVVLTAAHVIMAGSYGLQDVFFVFGYAYENPNTPPSRIPEENVYEYGDVLAWEYDKRISDEHDWIMVELDQPVAERFRNSSMRLTTSPEAVSRGTVVHTFSYPLGSPLSFSGFQSIGLFDDANSGDLHVPLDVSAGSSGAPVFNDQGQLVGIVIGKAWAEGMDFEIRDSNCYSYVRTCTRSHDIADTRV